MKETSVFILTLHAAILVFQLAAMFLFPSVRRALFGVYFILMPVGFSVFMDTDAWLIVGLVVAGLLWVLWTCPGFIDTYRPTHEARSNASGLPLPL